VADSQIMAATLYICIAAASQIAPLFNMALSQTLPLNM
jgi:hypothetical protein